MSVDGSTVGSDELESLEHIMKPHLEVMAMDAQYSPPLPKDTPDYLSGIPVLFCTYLKRGFLHIVAFHFGMEASPYLVDSLPLTLACETQDDLMDRMRILVALFTLQRHVVRLCSGWDEISWPQDLVDEAHQWIIEETGFATPNPSFGVPSDRGEEASWWYESAGSMDTENAGPCEDELEASEMKVKKWLGELIEDSDSCEPEPAVVKHEVGTTTVATATGRLPPVLGTYHRGKCQSLHATR
ncbi:hypothetical protein EW026_g8381 [Hermanssonia centrifuga]|uniref:Uncharacterized protein n=1 Tax=Hermanssonia centrifuga TaxID=98765 RepID=A0A4S4K499_9APHY|nr:hypothetical protein EW026_g8381 [Hermanssonia centrifuga]